MLKIHLNSAPAGSRLKFYWIRFPALFLLITIGLVLSSPHKVNLELMILDHQIPWNLGWDQSRLHHHNGGSSQWSIPVKFLIQSKSAVRSLASRLARWICCSILSSFLSSWTVNLASNTSITTKVKLFTLLGKLKLQYLGSTSTKTNLGTVSPQ